MGRSNRRIINVPSILVLCAVLLGGCVSNPVNIAPQPTENSTKLGRAEGSACGSMMILSTAYNFIPVMLSSRVERAYANAVASVPGAKGLVNVTMQEDWFWWVLGHTRCVTITGEAV